MRVHLRMRFRRENDRRARKRRSARWFTAPEFSSLRPMTCAVSLEMLGPLPPSAPPSQARAAGQAARHRGPTRSAPTRGGQPCGNETSAGKTSPGKTTCTTSRDELGLLSVLRKDHRGRPRTAGGELRGRACEQGGTRGDESGDHNGTEHRRSWRSAKGRTVGEDTSPAPP